VAGIITFGIGIAVASAWHHGWGRWDWGHRNVYVNVNRTVNINRTTTVINTRDMRTTTWQHSPEHRRGVAYRDPGTREKFAPANRQAVDNRRDFRGYTQTAPARPGSTVSRPGQDTRTGPAVARPAPAAKPAPDTRPGPATVARPLTQTRPESAVSRPGPDTRTAPAVTRPAPEPKPGPATVESPSTQTRPGSTVSRPGPDTRTVPAISRPAPSNTIYGVDQGNKTRKESARGRDSLSSPKGKEAGSSKPSPGVSKPAPAERPASAPGGQMREGGGPGRK
jgi:hypothetical protein